MEILFKLQLVQSALLWVVLYNVFLEEKTVSIFSLVKEENVWILHVVYTTVNEFIDKIFFYVDPWKKFVSRADHKREMLLIEVRMWFDADLILVLLLLHQMLDRQPVLQKQEGIWF